VRQPRLAALEAAGNSTKKRIRHFAGCAFYSIKMRKPALRSGLFPIIQQNPGRVDLPQRRINVFGV
jgi:hypothetical protein